MKRAAYEDVVNALENKVAEILDAELFLSARPPARHAFAASRLGRALGSFDDDPGGPGGWWIVGEPEVHLGEHVLVPDLAGWLRERMAVIPDVAFFTLTPAWVCEVLCPSTERIDRGHKLRIYADAGVAHAWLVKPSHRTLEVLRLHEGSWTIVGVWEDAAVVRAEPFEAIELQLGRLWPDEASAAPPRR
jgi:Uma2 family endonuclease